MYQHSAKIIQWSLLDLKIRSYTQIYMYTYVLLFIVTILESNFFPNKHFMRLYGKLLILRHLAVLYKTQAHKSLNASTAYGACHNKETLFPNCFFCILST